MTKPREPGLPQPTGGSRWPWGAGVVFVALAGLQAATQALAALTNLYASDRSFFGFYAPWRLLLSGTRWYQTVPNAIECAALAGLGAVLASIIALAVLQSQSRLRKNHWTHGSAHWASESEIRATGLLPRRSWLPWRRDDLHKAALYVGALVDRFGNIRYLRHRGNEHSIVVGPTRSGKTLGPILMNLLSWPYSMFVLDIKGELHLLTSGWRKLWARNKIIKWEPTDPRSPRWNVLDEVNVGDATAVGDAQKYANMVADPHGTGHDNHWDETAEALLAGLILYSLHKATRGGPRASLPQLDAELSNPKRDIKDLWREMVSMADICPLVASAAKDMLDRPEEEAGSVLSSTKKLLTLYRDPVIARATSASDFSLKDLRHHASPVTLYFVPTPDHKQRLQPLARMLVTSILRTSGVRMERIRKPSRAPAWWPFKWWPFGHGSVRVKAKYKHRMLMVFEEFKALGKHGVLQDAMSYIAGYGITCLISIQDITQLRSEKTGYGADEEFIAACHVKMAYPPNRPETAEYISRLLGTTTVLREQPTLRPNGFGRSSITIQEVQRPLLTGDEVLRIPGPQKVAGEESDIVAAGDMIVHVTGFAPIYCKQPLTIFEPIFLKRMELEPAPSDVLRLQVRL
jgi:type IV secretion system protein VirD4